MADLSITAANVVPSAAAQITRSRFAGATLTAGELVYIDTDDGTVKPADANASAATALIFGIAANGASAGQPVDVITEDPALAIGATVAAGVILVASGTAGKIAVAGDVATGWYVTVLAIGIGSNNIAFKLLPSGVAAA